jgi:hypothetical protein
VLYQDLDELLNRLDRLDRALDMGCTSLGINPRPEVAGAVIDTCWEAVRLGHELTRRLAYDDLWSDLDTLVTVWGEIAAMTDRVRRLEPRALDVTQVASAQQQSLQMVERDVAALDAAQLEVSLRPRDPQALDRARVAIAVLEANADRCFVEALGDDRHGSLDAAMALLTTIASRAARERASVSSRLR